MEFTFKELSSIKRDLEIAEREYTFQMMKSTPSDDENSLYQMFKRNAERTRSFIDRIENAIL